MYGQIQTKFILRKNERGEPLKIQAIKDTHIQGMM